LKKVGRYDVSGLVEAQCEPGSRGRVLKNLLGINKKREMERAETEALRRAMDRLIRTYDRQHRFTASDIRDFHRIWLGSIYEWAGKYRQVNVSQGGFMFAAANQVPALMEAFERGPLCRYTPCNSESRAMVVSGLAEVHTELILIHPFREGNGRVARILASLMALQAGLPLLNYSAIRGRKKQGYFAAVQAGLAGEYQPMERIFREVIARTLSAF
jgi:cell filamentation protein